MPTDADIKAFVEEKGLLGKPNVHVMTKSDVTGANMHPAWKIMQEATGSDDPQWNFDGKFIIGKQGDIKRVVRGESVADLIEIALSA